MKSGNNRRSRSGGKSGSPGRSWISERRGKSPLFDLSAEWLFRRSFYPQRDRVTLLAAVRRRSTPGSHNSFLSRPLGGSRIVDSKPGQITAFSTSPRRLRLIPAGPNRHWMQQTQDHFADRCLPLRIANQTGWFILNDVDITAIWNGADSPAGLQITMPVGGNPEHIKSHFGYGILTWNIPYLFRTPPGYNLYVRGPTNAPKDGACPLDGVVETDWAVATFTMNWKLTCVDVPVSFKAGEPIAMIMPIRRGEIEPFEIRIRDINVDPDLEREYKAWSESRRGFLEAYNSSKQNRMVWQKDYFLGNTVLGASFKGHQTNLKVKEIIDETGGNPTPLPSEPLTDNIGAKYREQRIVEQSFRLLLRRIKAVLGLGR
jgi:hypothetical protein